MAQNRTATATFTVCHEPGKKVGISPYSHLPDRGNVNLHTQSLAPTSINTIAVSVTLPSLPDRQALALIDTGATNSFIHSRLAEALPSRFNPLERPLRINNFDGTSTTTVTRSLTVDVQLGSRTFTHDLLVSDALPQNYDMVLGFDFSSRAQFVFRWAEREIGFLTPPDFIPDVQPPSDSTMRVSGTTTRATLSSDSTKRISDPTTPVSGAITGAISSSESSGDEIEPPKDLTFDWLDEMDYEPPDITEARRIVPKEYHDFLDVFSKEKGELLPDHQPHDLQINLVPDSIPPFGGVYRLATPELKVLRDYIDEMLNKGLIIPSSSSAASPVLFAPKKDGQLRLCVDYRRLNLITIKDRYPLPSTDMLIDRLASAKVFTKMDLRWAYHRIRIAAGHEWKTAFRTRYSLFEYKVMPFGLTNCPATFQRHVNTVLRNFIDIFVVVYLDDILIYSDHPSDHRKHVRMVLLTLRQHALYAKADKCDFHTTRVEYLGFVISPSGIHMSPSKVDQIANWSPPTNVRGIRSFLGFANFYRRFILGYSQVTLPLTALLRKDTPFVWSPEAQSAFDTLKSAFTTEPILQHFNGSLPTTIETDASDFAIGGVLFQLHPDGFNHPVSYISRTLNPAERNYDVSDKEMLAIVYACRQWRPLLLSLDTPFVAITDHSSLTSFMSTKVLTRRQVRWSESLADFDFTITYRPGLENTQADILSRRDDVNPFPGGTSFAARNPENERPFFQVKHLLAITTEPSPHYHQADLLFNALRTAQLADPVIQELRELTAKDGRYTLRQDLLLYKDRIYVPDNNNIKLRILQSRHDHPTSGHPGVTKTLLSLRQDFYWPGVRQYVVDYVDGCTQCQRAKVFRHRRYGLLQPLPIPERPWSSLSMDFIDQLPRSDDFDAILVVVCRLTKMALFIPTTTSVSTSDLVDLFIRNVFSKHGVPSDIVSDRGSRFTSKLWTAISKALGIQQNLSTAYHPQTDGQTERVNQIVETYLRLYVNYDQDDWNRFLPLAEFAYNNSPHSATTMLPFLLNKGFHPTLDIRISNITSRSHGILLERISELHEHAKQEIRKALDIYKENADKRRSPGPAFDIGSKAYLSTENLSTTRPTKKFAERRLGPFNILAKVSDLARRLELPSYLRKVHPVFHISLLEPARPDKTPGRKQAPPPPVELADGPEWEVEEILDSKLIRNKLHYLVSWKGFQDDELERQSWEPEANVRNSSRLIKTFHQRHPEKPSGPS